MPMEPQPYRTALITGASSGIGAALALELARAGVRVVLAARRVEALEQVAAAVTEGGGQADVLALDVSEPEAVVARLQALDDELDGLDLVIANAGVGRERWSGKLEWAELCAPTIAVNVAGATATLVALLPRMVARKRGHLVGVSSLAQYRGMPRSAVYSASKAYLSHFLEAVRIDLRGTGVHVTDVRPGFVRTPMTANNKGPLPFAISAQDAAARTWAGIRRRAGVVAYPLPTATVVRTLAALPDPLYDALAARFAR